MPENKETPGDRFKRAVGTLFNLSPEQVSIVDEKMIDDLAETAIEDPVDGPRATEARRIINDFAKETRAEIMPSKNDG